MGRPQGDRNRNLLVAIAFLGFSFLMARYKGLPNVLIVMFALIALFAGKGRADPGPYLSGKPAR